MEVENKTLNYDLNTKYIVKNILFISIIAIMVGLVVFALFYVSFQDALRYRIIAMIVAPCLFVLGFFGCIISIINNIRLIKYNKKSLLTISNNQIKYDAFLNENIIIEKENILKINITTKYNDMKYMVFLRVRLKNPIILKSTTRKSALFNFNRTISFPNDIYINISELKGDLAEIIKNISDILNIEIKPNKRIVDNY